MVSAIYSYMQCHIKLVPYIVSAIHSQCHIQLVLYIDSAIYTVVSAGCYWLYVQFTHHQCRVAHTAECSHPPPTSSGPATRSGCTWVGFGNITLSRFMGVKTSSEDIQLQSMHLHIVLLIVIYCVQYCIEEKQYLVQFLQIKSEFSFRRNYKVERYFCSDPGPDISWDQTYSKAGSTTITRVQHIWCNHLYNGQLLYMRTDLKSENILIRDVTAGSTVVLQMCPCIFN